MRDSTGVCVAHTSLLQPRLRFIPRAHLPAAPRPIPPPARSLSWTASCARCDSWRTSATGWRGRSPQRSPRQLQLRSWRRGWRCCRCAFACACACDGHVLGCGECRHITLAAVYCILHLAHGKASDCV
eukprot:355484-Chlamydomonas_euryale.AAC.1